VTEGADTLASDAAPDGVVAAGTLLREGREAAGLTVAAVAQQLKLAPRQIVALEEGDFAKLPGRTFVRGFLRNYARLLRLDPDAVIAALPEAATPAAYEHPSLAPTPRPMGELPADVHSRPSAARWAIPLALVAVVTVAAVYEIARPPAEHSRSGVIDKPALPAAPVADKVPAAAVPGNTTHCPIRLEVPMTKQAPGPTPPFPTPTPAKRRSRPPRHRTPPTLRSSCPSRARRGWRCGTVRARWYSR